MLCFTADKQGRTSKVCGMKQFIEKVLSGVVLLAAVAIFILAHIYSRRHQEKIVLKFGLFEGLRPQIGLRKV